MRTEILGFAAIAVIAFLLGITFTAMCFKYKELQEEADKEDRI